MSARLAWLVLALTLAFVAATVVLSWGTREYDGIEPLFGLAQVAYAAVGALIVARHPRHPVGWLFCLVGLSFAGSEAVYSYATHSFEGLDELPGATAAAWLSAWTSEPTGVLIGLLLMVFPNGRFLSPRWRRVGVTAGAGAVVWAVAAGFDPGRLRNFDPVVANPVGIDGLGPVLDPIAAAAPALFLVFVLAAAASVVVRFRRAEARERRQIKWLALAAGYAVGAMLVMVVLLLAVDTDEGAWDAVSALLICSVIAGFPVAAGIAILRSGLYDIDVVINRALVYGALTATLAGAYLGSVVLLQLVVAPLTEDSSLAVAGSTLAVAALVRPARARIQGMVDHRFYRRRYDAARTLERFGAHLRDEVDLEALSGDLRGVVRDTVQPAHVSLWLRGPGAGR